MRTSYQERRALGCRVQLAIVTADGALSDDILKRLWLQILYFEKRCSRFLPESELSQFNRQAGSRQFVSSELRDILLAARMMADRTDGLYNPFVLPAVQRAGYVGSLEPDRTDDAVDDFSKRHVVLADRLLIGDDWAEIPYGTAIDLGGCGKGYIGDRLAELVCNDGMVAGFWFSIGGDVIIGGHDENDKPWTVYLQPDPNDSSRIGEVVADDYKPVAIATSTTRFRRGEKAGKRWHHIIDPRTGAAADSDVDLATVRADSLLVADVLATCLIIAGADEAERIAAGQSGVQAAAWQSDATKPLHTWGKGLTAYPVGTPAPRNATG